MFFLFFSECRHLLTGLLNIDPKARPSVDDILNHPWLKSQSDISTANDIKEDEKLEIIKNLLRKADGFNEEKKRLDVALVKAKNQNIRLQAKLGIARKV